MNKPFNQWLDTLVKEKGADLPEDQNPEVQ
jgi:hypothetical protein